MDKRRQFRVSENVRSHNKREERRLNNRLNGDLEGSLRIGLSGVDQEKKKILAELDKTRRSTTQVGSKRGDAFTQRKDVMLKYANKPMGFSVQDSPRLMTSSTSRFRRIDSSGRRLSGGTLQDWGTEAGSESFAERHERKKIRKMHTQNDEEYRKVQEKIKQFNMGVITTGSQRPMAKEHGMRTQLEKLEMANDINNEHDGNEGLNSRKIASKTEQPLSQINMKNVKNSIARRLARSSPSGVDGRLEALGEEPEFPSVSHCTDSKPEEDLSKRRPSLYDKTIEHLPDDIRLSTREESRIKHLQSSDTARRHSKLISVESFLSNPVFNPELYNPDGSLRTVHIIPDFEDSYEEAKKAKYIRQAPNVKSEYEQELSVQQIFEH